MGYQEVQIDVTVQEHFELVKPHCHERLGKKFENPHIEKAFADKVGHHDWLYWVHIKTGHLGNHHHFTIVYEIKHHHVKLIDVHEGHKTFF